MNQSYVPAHLAIEAMRDNGYKNTAYAVAELIDNSIQADADFVQLICAENDFQTATRKIKRLNQIAVLDNGSGMNIEVLKMALQFGNGTRLHRNQRDGMGRFGMGLPASSISQCRRVDVWSWQDGSDNSYHTYLDIDEVKANEAGTIPEPMKKSIPDLWKNVIKNFGNTGTLIVWSRLDRLMWSKGNTLIDNSEKLIGRMYRKFLNDSKVKIQLTVFSEATPFKRDVDKQALPNDPLYLMEKTSCPSPFNNQRMFDYFGGQENFEKKYTIEFQGAEHEVSVRLSYAKEEVREKTNAGASAFGRHAKDNIGISILRAGRELELDQTLVLQYDPRERWWGIEVEFPPSLDDLMGVTNNKQTARNFSDILRLAESLEEVIKSEKKSLHTIMEELADEGDPRGPLLEVGIYLLNQLKYIRKMIELQNKGKNNLKNFVETKAEQVATTATDIRKKEGFIGASDLEESVSSELKQTKIIEELVDLGLEKEVATQLSARTVSNNLKYLFAASSFESDAFFTVRPSGGAITIGLNTRHPAYKNLVELLDEDTDNCDINNLKERLAKASEGLRLLLMAWARYEDELIGDTKEKAQETRSDWGRIAKYFLK